jgi:hypothetical protein
MTAGIPSVLQADACFLVTDTDGRTELIAYLSSDTAATVAGGVVARLRAASPGANRIR